MRGATCFARQDKRRFIISIHTPHAGSDYIRLYIKYPAVISIHTPHAGSDPMWMLPEIDTRISIHTPHAGSDIMRPVLPAAYFRFQSTLPMRGATERVRQECYFILISIHTPHAGSDSHTFFAARSALISIHTPHAGSDIITPPAPTDIPNFNPHSPCGERRLGCMSAIRDKPISIHTPHAGSDTQPKLL